MLVEKHILLLVVFLLRLWIVNLLVIIIIIMNTEKIKLWISPCMYVVVLWWWKDLWALGTWELGLVACVGKGERVTVRLYFVHLPWPTMSYPQAGPVSPSISLDLK
jgi:hypothetical protein